MFKPARILQVALVIFAVAGCAAPPAPVASGITAAPQQTDSKPTLKPDPPPIHYGDSQSARTVYHLPDGELSPWLAKWADEVASSRDIPLETVTSLLKDVRYNAQAARLMAPSKGRIKRSWVTYRGRFVDPIRIKAGAEFWQQHQQLLAQTEDKYGVPAAIIVAIIGVETVYGRHTGDFKVLDALATLGFSYPDNTRPERGELFRNQLADLIDLHHQGKLNAQQAYGSYAGAMGLPQFMPGSLMRYAVDGDNDGRIDLFNSMPDIMESVAHFLIVHGWQPGLPVFVEATLPTDPQSFVHGGLEPTHTWAELQRQGASSARAESALWANRPLSIINLVDEPRSTVEYRIATENFFAITHYNRSYFYAASVAELANALSREMGQGG